MTAFARLAPGSRVRGRRVRYHIGAEPGQIPGMRWQGGASTAAAS
ncbi:tryptophan biosynthesis modulator TrpM [Streptomyces flavofungini]